jgi:8-amino-7-oxononanoate synthase
VPNPSTTTLCSLDDALRAGLDALRERDLERTLRVVSRREGAIVETKHGSAVDFASNDYLGLATNPRLAEAATNAIREYGIGSGASRLISGNNPEHVALECELADYFESECALTFSSGYAANVGIIPALVGRGDAIFADTLNHASLIDGCRLSRASVYIYPHLDVTALAALLQEHRASARRALIVTDGLFSMDGDHAPIAEIVDLARQFGAWTYVDDAHAVGVLGVDGRGSASAARLQGQVDVTVGTLGKAFGVAGAFVYGSATLIQYLINRARSFIFSTAMMPAQAAAAREAVRIVRTEPTHREKLLANAIRMTRMLHGDGIQAMGDAGAHIVPVMIGDAGAAVAAGAQLASRGYLVGALRPPTVPNGASRLRITVSAAHTPLQIGGLAETLAGILRK